MSAGRKQFAVYRLKQDLGRMEVLRNRSWSFIQKYRIRITSDYYEQICDSPFSWDFEPAELRRQLENGLPAAASGEKLQVSDVLVITRDGVTTAYYVDPEKLIVLAGFFHTTASTSLLSIDTMPSLGVMTINALVAADRVLIPVQAAYLPVKGLQQLIKTVTVVKKRLNKDLEIEGILITMVDYRTNYAKDITEMLHESYGDTVGIMESFIPFSVKVAEASAEGSSIYRYAPRCKVTESFERLTKEVLENEE